MKLKNDDGRIFDNEDDLKDYVCKECDESYIEEFLNDTYNGFETNIDSMSAAEVVYAMNGNLESYREDEDLFEYLTGRWDNSYIGFDASDYDEGEVIEVGGIEFVVIFDEEDKEDDDDE